MKSFKSMILSSLIALSFSACGGGGSSNSNDTNTQPPTTPEDTTIKISLDNILCVTGTPSTTDIEKYETLLSGDIIVKSSEDTVISIYHDLDGVKKVCLVSGSAYIERN